MKNQALFSLKEKSKKIKMSSAAIFVRGFHIVNDFVAYRSEFSISSSRP